MESELVNEIIACLPQDRTLLHYYRDRYAVYLLEKAISNAEGAAIADVKRTPFGKFLKKSVVQNVLACSGGKTLDHQLLHQCWPREPREPREPRSQLESYRLSLGSWGDKRRCNDDWQQTTRRGANLVLHLNFNSKHDADFHALTGVDERQSFNYFAHPNSEKCRNTLAWARLDVDFASNSVLIEEIQTDWIRRVDWAVSWILQSEMLGRRVKVCGVECQSDGLVSYRREILARHEKMWSEAMLFATIWFIHQELGVKTIFYHTSSTGSALKSVGFGKPPKSIYDDLPRRFGFVQTAEGPNFLHGCSKARRRLKKVHQPAWYKMAV